MRFLSQSVRIARLEGRFYRAHPRLLWAAAAVAFIPALYVVIYLSSVWDPASHLGALPAGLVNLDKDVRYHDQVFNLGREVTDKLRAGRRFGYVEIKDPEEARGLVRTGRLAFALIIPADFSSNAIPGADMGAGRLEVFVSEGNSYQGAALARRFAEDLGHEINERLNERRWALVLSKTVGSQRSVERLRSAVDQLGAGAHELARGAGQGANGAASLSTGIARIDRGVARTAAAGRELGGALRALEARQPAATDLQHLKAGSEALAAGHAELGNGLARLHQAARTLHAGAMEYRDEARSSLFMGGRILEGSEQFADNLGRLETGLDDAVNGQRRLAEGAQKLHEGVVALTGGLQAQGAAVRTIVGGLPSDGQFDELAAGTAKLAAVGAALADGNRSLKEGALRLAAGIDLLADALPDSPEEIEGSAEGLANSVSPVVRVEAPVENNGSAYAPNIIAAALWLGAGIAAFLVHVRVMPREARDHGRVAQLAGKIALPSLMVLLQMLLVVVAVRAALGMRIADMGVFVLGLAVAALTFLIIVFALTKAFGDAGKAIAVLFLAVQLSSSGGVLPVELSGRVFMDISPWLPFTWVVRAIKVGMFGAFDQAWHLPVLLVAGGGLVAGTFACLFGHWRYVDPAEIRPAVDL